MVDAGAELECGWEWYWQALLVVGIIAEYNGHIVCLLGLQKVQSSLKVCMWGLEVE